MSQDKKSYVKLSSGKVGEKESRFEQPPTIEIIKGTYNEAIIVTGSEVHKNSAGTKMMFLAQAVRASKILTSKPNAQFSKLHHLKARIYGDIQRTDLASSKKDHKHKPAAKPVSPQKEGPTEEPELKVTILYFTHGYNDEEIKAFTSALEGTNVKLLPIATAQEIVDYFNEPTYDSDLHKRKIKLVHFYSHGLPSKIVFALDLGGEKETEAVFSFDEVTNINADNFHPEAKIYSYACRTGNTSQLEDFGPHYRLSYTEPAMTGIGGDVMETEKLIALEFSTSEEREEFKQKNQIRSCHESQIIPADAHPENSLAQKMADHLNITVHAFISRTVYGGTWDNGNKEDEFTLISDYTIKEAKKTLDEVKRWINDNVLNEKGARLGVAMWHPNGAFKPVEGSNTPKGVNNSLREFLPTKKKEEIEMMYHKAYR